MRWFQHSQLFSPNSLSFGGKLSLSSDQKKRNTFSRFHLISGVGGNQENQVVVQLKTYCGDLFCVPLVGLVVLLLVALVVLLLAALVVGPPDVVLLVVLLLVLAESDVIVVVSADVAVAAPVSMGDEPLGSSGVGGFCNITDI